MTMALGRTSRLTRTVWGALDQGVSSLVTLALTVAVARGADPREFGFFSLALMVSTILQSLNRAAVSDPLTIRFSARTEDEVRAAARQSLASSALLGAGFGALMAVSGLMLGSSIGIALVAFGLCAPLVALQEGCRLAFLAMGRSRAMFVIDLIWLSTMGVAVAVVMTTADGGLVEMTASWGLGALVSCLVALRWLRVRPAVRGVRPWLRSHRDLSSPLVLDQVTMLAGSQATIWAVGATVGVAGLGALRVVQVAFGPLTTAFTAVWLVAVPELVRITAHSAARTTVAARRLSVAMGLLAMSAGLGVWLMPTNVGRALFGESWILASEIVIPMAFVLAATGAQTGWIVAAKALELGRGLVRARSVTTGATAVVGVAGASIHGLRGAVVGMAVGGWIGVAGWRHEVVSAVRARESETTGWSHQLREQPITGTQFLDQHATRAIVPD